METINVPDNYDAPGIAPAPMPAPMPAPAPELYRRDWDITNGQDSSDPDWGEMERKWAEEEREREWTEMKGAGVPYRFIETAMAGVVDLPPLLASWVEEVKLHPQGKPWFYIGGGTGAGKTTLAAVTCLALIRERERPIFINARKMKQEWDAGGLFGTETRPTKHEAMRPYMDAQLLVLDGLGEERTDRAFCDCLFDVIGARYDEERPTLITSQFGLRDYRERMERAGYDSHGAHAIASRIAGGMGGSKGFADHLIALNGEDRRTV